MPKSNPDRRRFQLHPPRASRSCSNRPGSRSPRPKTGSTPSKSSTCGGSDLVISDVNMPNMDGIALTRHIRQPGKHQFTPILMLTTESQSSMMQEGKSAGATGWIVKPFEPDKLLAVVKKTSGLTPPVSSVPPGIRQGFPNKRRTSSGSKCSPRSALMMPRASSMVRAFLYTLWVVRASKTSTSAMTRAEKEWPYRPGRRGSPVPFHFSWWCRAMSWAISRKPYSGKDFCTRRMVSGADGGVRLHHRVFLGGEGAPVCAEWRRGCRPCRCRGAH